MGNETAVKDAHKHSFNNREELTQSDNCGCFSCIEIFKSSEVKEWIDNGQTAHCPRCYIDAVIGDKSGYPITEDFLTKMYKRWF